MLIEHETCPAIALKIVRTGIFQTETMLSDRGLNAVAGGQAGGDATDQAKYKGAVLKFEWPGQPIKGHGHQPGVLYQSGQWRFFLPCNSAISLIDVRLCRGHMWEEAINPPGFNLFSFGTWSKDGFIKNEVEAIKKIIQGLKTNPILISVKMGT